MASKIKFHDKPKVSDRLWLDNDDIFQKKIFEIEDPYLIDVAKSFKQNGYVVIKHGVDKVDCDNAVQAFYKWCLENEDVEYNIRRDPKKKRVVNLQTDVAEFKDLYCNAEVVLAIQDFLFGYTGSVYSSIAFEYGTEQPLHIDTPVFCTSPKEFYFGLWIALEDATEENGCLRVVPGGHKNAYVDQYEFAERAFSNVEDIKADGTQLWNGFQNELLAKCYEDGLSAVSVPVEKGDVIIWHPQLPHGGSKVTSPDKTRLSVVFHVVPEGIPVYQADVFFNRANMFVSNDAEFYYEKYNSRLFRIGRNSHFGGN